MKNNLTNNIITASISILAIILFILLLHSIYWGLMIIVMELIFATILDTPVSFLEKHKFPRTIGSLICIFVILGVFINLNLMIIPKASPEFSKLIKSTPEIVSKIDNTLETYFISMNIDDIFGMKYEKLKENSIDNLKNNLGNIFSNVRDKSAESLESFSTILLGLILLWYIVIDPRPLEKGFLDPWSPNYRKKLRRVMLRIKKMLVSWAFALCCGCFAIFILTWIGLSIIKFPCAFFFAVFAGFMNIIPTIGPIIAAIIPCILVLVLDPKLILYILIVYGIIQQLESNLITPLIMRKQLDIHPFILIHCIVIFGYFFGVVGCFLTAPILASISIIYDELYAKPRLNKKN